METKYVVELSEEEIECFINLLNDADDELRLLPGGVLLRDKLELILI